jgi:PadR family transcriptional regulator, regulatory protein AphA
MSPRQSSPLSLEFILLGFLLEKPVHGYDLYREISSINDLSEVWHIKQSQLYALLEKLESAGMVSSTHVTTESFIARREYKATPEGKATFQVWIALPVEHPREMRQEFLGKLYFARQVGTEKALALVSAQRQNCMEWQTMLEKLLTDPEPGKFSHIVDSFRMHQVKSILSWLDEVEGELRIAL